MKLHFYQDPRGNFGDDLNAWFWDAVLPGFRDWDTCITLIGVGTLLNEERLGALRDQRLLVLGSGVGYGSGPPVPLSPLWDIRAVRGPLSAQALQLPAATGLTDPAALLPLLPEFQGLATQAQPVFIPHHASVRRHDWATACHRLGISYVSPEEEAKQVIRKIASAPLVLAEAMHGAIVADAFRVPWVPLRIGPRFHLFKWQDWLSSLALQCEPAPLFPALDQLTSFLGLSQRSRLRQARLTCQIEHLLLTRALERALQRPSFLSHEAVLKEKQQIFMNLFQTIQQEYT